MVIRIPPRDDKMTATSAGSPDGQTTRYDESTRRLVKAAFYAVGIYGLYRLFLA